MISDFFYFFARRQGIEPSVHARFWRPAASISYGVYEVGIGFEPI
jgi:hypothetical protein